MLKRTALVTCPRGWPRWGQRQRWRAGTRSYRPFPTARPRRCFARSAMREPVHGCAVVARGGRGGSRYTAAHPTVRRRIRCRLVGGGTLVTGDERLREEQRA